MVTYDIYEQGKTISALVFILWTFLFGTSNSMFVFINKDGDASKGNLRRLVDLLHALPEYMQARSIVDDTGKREKAKENATVITNPVNNNTIIVKAKATSLDRAVSIARGLTAPCQYFDLKILTGWSK